jgi:regulator of RNase E activity RraA
MNYTVKKQDGEWIVANSNGIIISYCDTQAQAQDVKQAQQRDTERGTIEAAYNAQQAERAMRSEYRAEFN